MLSLQKWTEVMVTAGLVARVTVGASSGPKSAQCTESFQGQNNREYNCFGRFFLSPHLFIVGMDGQSVCPPL